MIVLESRDDKWVHAVSTRIFDIECEIKIRDELAYMALSIISAVLNKYIPSNTSCV